MITRKCPFNTNTTGKTSLERQSVIFTFYIKAIREQPFFSLVVCVFEVIPIPDGPGTEGMSWGNLDCIDGV